MIILAAAFIVVILLVFQRRAYAEDPKERQWHTPTFNPQHADKPKVEGWAKEQVVEHLSRGLIGKATEDGKVYLSWRMLASDPED
ncbi:MAG TPA: silent information regulator protein Sir2, partial [Firmicutes bacterium]|nr:silent information regulator protein Sir2 [Bacillota bacterium]